MEQVSMNDGLDGRETVAFGLAAGEVAVFVLALMSAYVTLRSGLPGAAAWCAAGLLCGAGGALAWGRLAGRPLLDWAVLLARFMARNHRAHLAGVRRRLPAAPPASRPVVRAVALRRHAPPASRAAAAGAAPCFAIVGEGRAGRARGMLASPSPALGGGCHVVAFFSLNGGSGRTTIAVELATLLAVRGSAESASGGRGLRVALLDLTARSPSVALRLGIPLPAIAPGRAAAPVVAHQPGLLVLPASPQVGAATVAAGEPARAAIAAAERGGADVVVVDVDCDLGAGCVEVLRRCDEVHITVTPSAAGVLDAYRSTAALRRLGLRDRLGYVVNRWHEGADVSEAMADLGGSVGAMIPEDRALVRAENHHRPAVLDGAGAVRAALLPMAERIESATQQSSRTPRPWADGDAS